MPSMILTVMVFLAGLALLTAGAEGLVRGSASLAIRFGLTPLIVGLTVVAFGTSTPELVVSVGAALSGQGDIAVGNVVGSNIFNIAVILGLTALVCPIRVSVQVIRQDGPIALGVALLALLLLAFDQLGRLTGVCLLACLAGYTGYTVYQARREKSQLVEEEFREGIPGPCRALWMDLLWIAAGLVLLVGGSRLMVTSAIEMARSFGVSEAVIGLTIIAAGTSMPELATSLVAAFRRQPDIAVGNAVGSNIFNILCILGAAAVARPLSVQGITLTDAWVMVAFSVALLPLLYTGLRLQRWEGGLLLAAYGAYLWHLWP